MALHISPSPSLLVVFRLDTNEPTENGHAIVKLYVDAIASRVTPRDADTSQVRLAILPLWFAGNTHVKVWGIVAHSGLLFAEAFPVLQ
jgi:hypothetical protein